MESNYKLKCPVCDSVLHLEVAYDGCDWKTVAGDNSGYEYPISLVCKKDGCGCVFTLGRLKQPSDFSEVIEDCRLYNGMLNN